MKVIKRSGEEVTWDNQRIFQAISKANDATYGTSNEISYGPSYIEQKLTKEEITNITNEIEEECKSIRYIPNVEEIQVFVNIALMKSGHYLLAKNYITYSRDRQLSKKENTTDKAILSLLEGNNEEINSENSNKKSFLLPTQRDHMAGEVSKDITRRFLLPKDIVDADNEGIIHVHDKDYFAQRMYNCALINGEDILEGTVINGTMIDKPTTFLVGCNVITQLAAQYASNQFGGQTITLAHLAPLVDRTRKKFRKATIELFNKFGIKYTEEQLTDYVESLVKTNVKDGVQTIQYQILTLMTANGQTPFITLFMNLEEVEEGQTRDDLAMIIEEVIRQRMKGIKNDAGQYVSPTFPKLVYLLDECNIHEDSKYYYLTKLCAECTCGKRRMVPDYISGKIMRELKGDIYPCMGCRSFLTPDRTTYNMANSLTYDKNKGKYYGRFNQGVVTLNLVDVALSSKGDFDRFDELMDERLDLCYRALMCRHKRLLGTKSDVAPVLWQHGAIARLKKGETIDKLLYDGYSTISLGYAGLYECVKYMTDASHTDERIGKKFAIKVMKRLNDACEQWKKETNIDFSVYGTPIESTTYTFAKCLQKRFGIIEGITDHNYVTNSYHVNVREKIDAFTKLKLESEFQKLSPGGAISYVEVPDMRDNIPATLDIIKYIYDNIMYAELNTKSDICHVCGCDREMEIVERDGKLIWECPECGNTDQNKMTVIRRTCGYMGSEFWNQGRTAEIKDRVIHLSQPEFEGDL